MPPPKTKIPSTSDLPDYNPFTGKSTSTTTKTAPIRKQNIMKSGNAGNKSSSSTPVLPIDPLIPIPPPPLFRKYQILSHKHL